MKKLLFILVALAVILAFTNPSEGDFREHVRQKGGVGGIAALAVMDLISTSKQGGIKRENFVVASRFYIGGNGIIPREDLAWGVAGMIIDKK